MSDRSQGIVASGYDAIAARYATWQLDVTRDPRACYVEELLALLPGEPDILEIGCGAGVEPTPTFARLGQLVGIDISRAQIERARSAVPDADFIRGDVTMAKFEQESFDAIVAIYVLTHIPASALPELLARAAGWLRPGGLLLGTFSTTSGEEIEDDWLGARMFFSGHDPPTNERLVQEAGLVIVRSRIETMQEPPTRPQAAASTVAFHWLLARKGG